MDDQTVLSRRNWDAVAAAWVRQRQYFAGVAAPVTEALLTRLSPVPGETVIDIAAGPGDVGLRVSSLVGDDGVVLVTDLSAEMIDGARALADKLGLDNVRFQVLDAQDMDLPDRSFDGACSRFGYMLMPDPAQALRETRRVLRPGGRLAFAVWGDRRENTWGTAATRALVQLGVIERPDPDAPGPFALDDLDRLAATLAAGRMEAVSVEDVTLSWPFDSPAHWWGTMTELSATLREGLASCPADLVDEVRAEAIALLDATPGPDGSGIRVPGVARVVLAHPR